MAGTWIASARTPPRGRPLDDATAPPGCQPVGEHTLVFSAKTAARVALKFATRVIIVSGSTSGSDGSKREANRRSEIGADPPPAPSRLADQRCGSPRSPLRSL